MPIGKFLKNKDLKFSNKLYREACKLIGLAIDEKDPDKKNDLRKKVLQLLKASTALDNPAAQYEFAQQYDEYGLFGQNDRKAVYWYKKASKNGHCEASNSLANYYTLGKVVKRNLKKAKDLTLFAANNGSISAQYNMGVTLEKTDLNASINWFKIALRNGDKSAALKLASLYTHNEEIKNINVARKYLKMVRDLCESEMEEADALKKYLAKIKK